MKQLSYVAYSDLDQNKIQSTYSQLMKEIENQLKGRLRNEDTIKLLKDDIAERIEISNKLFEARYNNTIELPDVNDDSLSLSPIKFAAEARWDRRYGKSYWNATKQLFAFLNFIMVANVILYHEISKHRSWESKSNPSEIDEDDDDENTDLESVPYELDSYLSDSSLSELVKYFLYRHTDLEKQHGPVFRTFEIDDDFDSMLSKLDMPSSINLLKGSPEIVKGITHDIKRQSECFDSYEDCMKHTRFPISKDLFLMVMYNSIY
jgi:hypothetical protein